MTLSEFDLELEAGMHRPKRWNFAPLAPGAGELASRLKTSPLVAQILLDRGIREVEDCQNFLRPTLKWLHDPMLIPGLKRASERIARAIRDKEKLVIYGDYDVDGITAVAILWHAVRVLGGSCEFYIPHRIEEGYGLNAEALGQICDDGAKVIVSVDCGITALEQAKIATDRGVDLIVTDHHEWHAASFPDCFALVHPRLPTEGAAYPNPHLCGAGVALKLAWGIGLAMSGGPRVSEEFRSFLFEATALAALGTIADVVPLVGENRVLAHAGLRCLPASKLVGIQALIASARLKDKPLDSFDVGFLLAPRLNACGRMGHAQLAVELLTTTDAQKANQIVSYLEQQNRERQAVEKKILDQALSQIESDKWDADGNCAIVLANEGWHPGVIGIVASRIVERFHRPTIMVAMNNGCGQGSGRSIAGFHLARALENCAEYLDAYGGHEMAAGLKVKTEKLDRFRESFCEYAAGLISPQMLMPQLRLDAVAEVRQMTPPVVKDLERLGPFGHGNRQPLLCFRGLELTAPPRRVGKTGEHLQLLVRQEDRYIKCIAFGYGELFDHLSVGTKLDLAVEPLLNEYNGSVSVELAVRDIQFPEML